MYIKQIRIKNFRSITHVDIQLNDISIFVGLNDVGKSNVLKALNLFFNDETDYGKPLNFSEDYSRYAQAKAKKAPEISVELIFHAPRNYMGSKDISWIKKWRRTGPQLSDIRFEDGSKFPKRSKLVAWVQNIRFTYVPAIRDSKYFEILLAQLHDSLAETIEEELRTAGDDFIKKIRYNTQSMISGLDQRLKIKSEIRFPRNLQSLFRTLDFATGEGATEISLNNRGDGVKTRHIPVILKFIADQLNIIRLRGSPSVSMIWGYEEPENNLEMLAGFELAKEFLDYSASIQLFLTTHSPAFYGLKSISEDKTDLFRVTKSSGVECEITPIRGRTDADSFLGIMPIVTPYVEKKVAEILKLRNDIEIYQNKLKEIDKNSIFVEGQDEVRVFSKIVELKKMNNGVLVKDDALGCSGVKAQLMGWAWVCGGTILKAYGIFDNDSAGRKEWNKLRLEQQFKEAENFKLVGASYYRCPSHLTKIKSALTDFPIELEEMYPPQVWAYARGQQWLEDRDIKELNALIKLDNRSQSIEEKLNSLNFSTDEIQYILYRVPDKNKDKISKYVIHGTDSEVEVKLKPLIHFFDKSILIFFS